MNDLKPRTLPLPRLQRFALMTAAALLVPGRGVANHSLKITLTLEDARDGEVGEAGCALTASADGFPSNGGKALQSQWQPAAAEVSCEFNDLPEGTYAIGASHDRNGNRKVDTNFVGMPKEAWGVSRNARPSFRAPRFDEAAITVSGAGTTELQIQVRK